jgi:hypothetical protein
MQYLGTLYAIASRNYSDTSSKFLFESDAHDGIHWIDNTNLNVCEHYPDVSLGFFADDDQQICCAIHHSRQPGFVVTETTLPFFTQVSGDTIGAPFMWRDPETNTRMFMYRTNGDKTLKIFQEQTDGYWNLYNSFNSPLPDPFVYITSPEPFKFGGRSYVSFMAAQAAMGLAGMPAEIWIASVNPANPLMRRVSDSTLGVRLDPEPVIFDDSAFVYYSETISSKWYQHIHRVRKCDTGLENYYTRLYNDPNPGFQVLILPNPSAGLVPIKSDLINAHGKVSLIISDNTGRILRTYHPILNPFKVNPDLPPGPYILKLTGNEQSVTGKLTIL